MPEIIETFDAISIKNSSVQMFGVDGIKDPGTKFGSVGTIEGDTTMRELIKREEGVEVKKRTKPEKMNLTISAHVPIAIVRDIFGLSNESLEPGVYKYSKDAKGKEFTYTADVIDEFEDVTKLIAFPKCISSTGFKFTVTNGADEVAEMEVEVTVYPDEQGNLYYEAITAELADLSTIGDTWHSDFNYTLVEAVVV